MNVEEKAKAAAKQIWDDLCDRRGFGFKDLEAELVSVIQETHAGYIAAAMRPPKDHIIDETGAEDWSAVYVLQEKNIYGKPNVGIVLVGVDNDEKAAELAKNLERPGIAARVTRGVTIYSRAAAEAAKGGA